jgi:hypothetical protein
MGLRAATKEIRQDLECAVHSYSQVREFFLRTPCRLLQWTLLAVGDVWDTPLWCRSLGYGCAMRSARNG